MSEELLLEEVRPLACEALVNTSRNDSSYCSLQVAVQVSAALNLAVNNKAIARKVIDAAAASDNVERFIKMTSTFGRFERGMMTPLYAKVCCFGLDAK